MILIWHFLDVRGLSLLFCTSVPEQYEWGFWILKSSPLPLTTHYWQDPWRIQEVNMLIIIFVHTETLPLLFACVHVEKVDICRQKELWITSSSVNSSFKNLSLKPNRHLDFFFFFFWFWKFLRRNMEILFSIFMKGRLEEAEAARTVLVI